MLNQFPQSDVKQFWDDANKITGGHSHETTAAITLALVLMNGCREIADALGDVAKANSSIAGGIEMHGGS